MTDIEITNVQVTEPVVASAATSEPAPTGGVPADSPVVTVYSVFGMNCGHCANAVSRELSAIHGVTGVKVDLGAKKVTVGSTRPLSEDEVRHAVDEAGYELG
jgi:copper chaperone CopZ